MSNMPPIDPSQQTNEEWLADHEGQKKPNGKPKVSFKGRLIGPDLPLVATGEYRMTYVSHTIKEFMGHKGKCTIVFEIAFGPERGTRLEKYFNVSLGSDWKSSGEFGFDRRSYYCREMRRLLPDNDMWQDPANLMGLIVLAQVVDVTSDRDRYELSSQDVYSRVGRLIKVIEQ